VFSQQTSHTDPVRGVVYDVNELRAVRPDGRVVASRAIPQFATAISRDGLIAGTVYRGPTAAEMAACATSSCSYTYTSTLSEIALIDRHGKVRRRLTHGPYDLDPVFSPDGKQIAYLQHRLPHGSTYRDEVHVYDLPSGDDYSLTPPEAIDGPPVWSPRGDSVATLRNQGSRLFLARVPADGETGGASATVLATGLWVSLAWSHHGGTIVGAHVVRGARAHQPAAAFNLWAVSAAGGHVRRLTSFRDPGVSMFGGRNCTEFGQPMGGVLEPVFSPDDRSIGFLSTYPQLLTSFPPVESVMTVRLDGTQLREVYRPAVPSCSGTSQTTLHVLAWQ
jgi:dipeptidyl aminopeptidase/acylaminoacyl peptidase